MVPDSSDVHFCLVGFYSDIKVLIQDSDVRAEISVWKEGLTKYAVLKDGIFDPTFLQHQLIGRILDALLDMCYI